MKNLFRPTKQKFLVVGIIIIVIVSFSYLANQPKIPRQIGYVPVTLVYPFAYFYGETINKPMEACEEQCRVNDALEEKLGYPVAFPCECGFGAGQPTMNQLLLGLGAGMFLTFIYWYLLACIIVWLFSFRKKQPPQQPTQPSFHADASGDEISNRRE